MGNIIESKVNKYRNKVTLLSFILAILIVVRHSVGIDVYTLKGPLLAFEKFISDATDLVVPTFFALSGFLFYQNFERSKLKSKLQSRFRTLFVPYIIWNLIGFLYTLTLISIPIIGERMNREIPIFNFISSLKMIFWDCEYNVTWFVRDLMIFTLVTPMFKLLINRRILGAIIVLFIIGIGYYINNEIILYWSVYIFGAYMALNFKEICQKQYNNKVVFFSFFLLLVSLVAQSYYNFQQGASMIPLRLIQIVLIWSCADILSVNGELKWWMKISFFIYVTHSMILESIEKLFWVFMGDTVLGAITDLIFAPLITLFIIIAIAFVLKKITFVWNLLNGGRGA